MKLSRLGEITISYKISLGNFLTSIAGWIYCNPNLPDFLWIFKVKYALFSCGIKSFAKRFKVPFNISSHSQALTRVSRSRVSLLSWGSWRGKMGAGICLFWRLGNGILCTGTGTHEKKNNNRKMGMGCQFEQHRLGLWDLSWDLKKTISWEMGLGPPLHDPLS